MYDLDDIGNSNDDHSDDIGCKDKFAKEIPSSLAYKYLRLLSFHSCL